MSEPAAKQDGDKPPERQFVMRCLICDVHVICPDEADPWGWLKGEAANVFRAEHLERGCPPRAIGAEVRYIEKE